MCILYNDFLRSLFRATNDHKSKKTYKNKFEKILIASGSSKRQVIALAEKVQEGVKGLFRINCKVEGKENADWVLLDFGAVIVHIFKPEVREYYQIEKMWKGHLTQISS